MQVVSPAKGRIMIIENWQALKDILFHLRPAEYGGDGGLKLFSDTNAANSDRLRVWSAS